MPEPSWGKLSKDMLDGLSKRTLEITEGEIEGPGVFTNTGTNVSRRKSVEGMNMDLVVDRGSERGYEVVKNVF